VQGSREKLQLQLVRGKVTAKISAGQSHSCKSPEPTAMCGLKAPRHCFRAVMCAALAKGALAAEGCRSGKGCTAEGCLSGKGRSVMHAALAKGALQRVAPLIEGAALATDALQRDASLIEGALQRGAALATGCSLGPWHMICLSCCNEHDMGHDYLQLAYFDRTKVPKENMPNRDDRASELVTLNSSAWLPAVFKMGCCLCQRPLTQNGLLFDASM